MYCRNCGKEFADGDIFCTGCGQRKESAPTKSGIAVQLPQKSSQGRGLAIAAMVLGIISTIYSFLFTPGILGIVFGFSAKSQGNKSGMAIAGIVLLINRYKQRKIFVSDRCEILIPKEKRSSVIVKNFGVIFFIVIVAATFIIGLLPDFSEITNGLPDADGDTVMSGIAALLKGIL